MFCNIEGDEELAIAGVDSLLEQRVAGFVFLALIERTPQLAGSLRRTGVPIVAIGLRQELERLGRPRDREGGPLAAQHLLDLGHRRIGYVRTVDRRGRRRPSPARRIRGRSCATPADPAAGVGWDPGPARSASAAGQSRCGALSGPGAPTAVVVWNDHGAIG